MKKAFAMTGDDFARAVGISRAHLYNLQKAGMPCDTVAGAIAWLSAKRFRNSANCVPFSSVKVRRVGLD